MLQTTGISRQQAIDAARTIIGYYNTFALDTVARILRLTNLDEISNSQDFATVADILDLHMDSDLEQLKAHIEDYDNMSEIRNCAETILNLLDKNRYLDE